MSYIVLFEMIWFLQWVLGLSLIVLLAHAGNFSFLFTDA